VATRVVLWLLLTPPVTMENVTLVDPAAAVTELGTLSWTVFVKWMATVSPPAGAAADRVILQVADACAVSSVELQANPVRVTGGGGGGVSITVKFWEVPFRVAASTTLVFTLTADAFAVKLAEFKPAGTRTDAGMVMPDPETGAVVTVRPPDGAGADKATVHAVEPGVVTIAGAHARPVTVYGEVMVTWPPVAVTLRVVSLGVTPLLFSTWIGNMPIADSDTVKVAVATTPVLIVVVLRPNSMHVYDPELPLHETDLPAATAAGPATTVTELKVVAG
jgi:hypothetical protein